MIDDILEADKIARKRALDPAQSFIVQAPAGSGKTGLLIQRVLTLLGRVDAPEEVMAITFTRKAAGEMRERVLSALNMARTEAEPSGEHECRTWHLARAVLERDEEKNWQLQDNPMRLRMQTIDSLCASLTRQMPLLSNFGAQPGIAEDASELYMEAARATLALLEAGNGWSLSVQRLLEHLDNNLQTVENLLSTMLARRDQWLRHLADRADERIQRESLEASLEAVVSEALDSLRSAIPMEIASELMAIVRHAAGNVAESGERGSELLHCCDLIDLPTDSPEDLPVWRGIAQLLLTNDGGWRKSLTAAIGILPPSKASDKAEKERRQVMKTRLESLIGQMAEHDRLRVQLDELRMLPPIAYEEQQWVVMEALFELLPLAVAQLRLAFLAQGQVDFTEVAQAAIRALGEENAPTDLALALDYRIRHLLVDEFQDTSLSQYALLSRLTAGWEEGDGRTLFVVGDPMQSIYRFREAEVGLYLRARHEGIGTIRLQPITLRVNFRSQEGVVTWVNEAFSKVLPPVEDISSGAVPYSESIANKSGLDGTAVQMHPFFGKDRAGEAGKVVELVQQARTANPDGKVAILVRNRSHLAEIIPALQDAKLRFRAIEIEALGQLSVIQDLQSLTRALTHPADRLAWLAVLRAPWCGLTLADLHALAGNEHSKAVWDLIQDESRLASLSEGGQVRLGRVRTALQNALPQRQRRPLRRWVEGVWLALGGPAAVDDDTALEDAKVYFEVLEQFDTGGNLTDFAGLAEKVARLFALPDVQADDALQIMTIHKSKGLEFDTVIVPGLGRIPRQQESRLLIWAERPRGHGQSDLLLAPIREAGRKNKSATVYTYLQLLDQRRGGNEDGRLLYVACTRAKRYLHLLGSANASVKKDGAVDVSPASNSLLDQLWPAVEATFSIAAQNMAGELAAQTDGEATEESRPVFSAPIQRLKAGWTLPVAPPSVSGHGGPETEGDGETVYDDVEFQWASETAKYIGVVVHRWLQIIAQQGVESWDDARINELRPAFTAALARLGVAGNELEMAVERAVQAIGQTVNDQRGRWLLANRHPEAYSEYPLTGMHNGELVNIVIDRTFVDEHGVRWIIDYKTSSHEGGNLEGFLDNERARYTAQLERYAKLMMHLDARPIRLGLYFPLIGGWREWEFNNR